MPYNARRIIKLDPENDSVCFFGDDFGPERNKYKATVAGRDGFVYGIPNGSKRITRFDPVSHNTSILRDEARRDFKCIIIMYLEEMDVSIPSVTSMRKC
jgi:hypothetical protein